MDLGNIRVVFYRHAQQAGRTSFVINKSKSVLTEALSFIHLSVCHPLSPSVGIGSYNLGTQVLSWRVSQKGGKEE